MIYKAINSFEPWGGAVANWNMLTFDEQDNLVEQLDENLMDENGFVEAVEINDVIWFDFEWCCELLGLDYDSQSDEIIRECD